MKKLTNLNYLLGATCCVGLALTACDARAQAQQPNRNAEGQRQAETQRQAGGQNLTDAQRAARAGARPGSFTLTLPPANGALEIVAEAPAEARVNSDIEYRLRIRNTTENLMLHEIVLAESESGTSQIQSVSLASEEGAQGQGQNRNQRNQNQRNQQGQGANSQNQNRNEPDQQNQNAENQDQDQDQDQNQAGQRNRNQQGQNQNAGNQNQNQNQNQDQAGQRNRNQQNQQGQNQQTRNRQNQNRQAQNQQGRSQGLTSGDGTWTIDKLGPGQSKTLVIKASADQEGPAMTCLTVRSMQPAICLMTEITKPEIQITKKAPEQAPLCEPFEIQYTVSNPGTGDIEAFTLRDPLPEGLRLIDEKPEISFEVNGLAAGDSRSFVARVVADRPGEYSSRAEAVAGENLQARSADVATRVIASDLAVQIEGPSQSYVNRNLTYTAFVHNAGQAPARDATLAIQLPQQNLRLIDMGSVRKSDRQFQSAGQNQPQEATQLPAENSAQRNAANQRNQQQNQQDSPQLAAAQTLEIGNLAPGETRQISFVVRATQADTFPVQAVATSVCGEEQENRQQAIAQTQVEILSLAALAIGVADEQDPVPVGKQVVYLVSVVNEGTAPDQNIQVMAQLPQNLEFVEGDGETEVSSEGGNVKFAPVETLEPGAKAEWRVVLQAKQPGNVRFDIDVTSDKSAEGVTAAEPTTLFQEK
ncbi:MAG TPA: hypothetical protein VGN57_18680 [Pirellulaceae bacterium]|jgi:uncharacterized repeat protein (TIGR01451 family)|nr:hypothetical protein [Pirellulaceae bacterium]